MEYNYKYRYKKEFSVSKIKDNIFTLIILFLIKYKWFKKLSSVKDSFWLYSLTDNSLPSSITYEEPIDDNKISPKCFVYFILSDLNMVDNFGMGLRKFLYKDEKKLNELFDRIADFKEGIKTIKTGVLCEFDISNISSEEVDYISHIKVYYTKTSESLISFYIKVSPSNKFIDIYNCIIKSKYGVKKHFLFFSLINIITKKKIIKDFKYSMFRMSRNINKLYFDLNWQIKNQILKECMHLFSDVKKYILPYLRLIKFQLKFKIEAPKFEIDKFK